MSFPFRRRNSSPRSPEHANGFAEKGLWKTSANRKGLIDIRKVIQLVGIGVVFITVVALFAGFLPEGEAYNDPFKVDRSPTAK